MKKHKGYIYLIKMDIVVPPGLSLIKIGRATALKYRFKWLSKFHSPRKLELIHKIRSKDLARDEFSLHRQFSMVKAIGEWFLLTDIEIEALKQIKRFYELTVDYQALKRRYS